MLIAFSVENYRSFKSQVTFSMVAAELSSKPKELDSTNVFEVREDLRLLTSAAIYGANASGKSNLIAAISFMRSLVLNSSRETRLRQSINVVPFRLSTATEQAPSRFEVVFLHEKSIYRYGFVVSRTQIEAEWLYATTGKKEGYLFERTLDSIKVNERTFKEGLHLPERTRNNALFLSVVTQWNGKRASAVTDWFESLSVNSGISEPIATRWFVRQYEDEGLPQDAITFVRSLDLGIEDMVLEIEPPREIQAYDDEGNPYTETVSGAATIRTVHTKYDADGQPTSTELFDLFSNESQGTRRLFALAEPILAALQQGTIFVVDELDARLHPILTAEIIRLFNTPETNPCHAQLIFTTHDTNLLGSELFRRDQIWFVEKSRQGESTIYSLAEYKVRNDAAYEKNYIAGRYGAIPYLGSLSAAIGVDDATQTEKHAETASVKSSGHADGTLPTAGE
jgi:uncharacterized protein